MYDGAGDEPPGFDPDGANAMKRRHDLPFPTSTSSDASQAQPGALSRRALLAALPAVGATGCIGSFALTNKLLDWNMSIGNKWVNWLVFVCFFILPVYITVWGLIDLFVINSIEFWTGSTPFSAKPTPDGGQIITERTDEPDVARVRHENAEGETIAEFYIQRVSDDEFRLLDGNGEVTMIAHGRQDATLRDGQGRRVARFGAAEMRRMARAMEQGVSPSETAWAMLEDQDQAGAMLALAQDLSGRFRV